jgi:hypothetical protein
MLYEPLESRCLLNAADALFRKDVVRLNAGQEYQLTKPVYLRSNQRIIGRSTTNPPLVKLAKKGKSVFVINPGVHDVTIRNVRFSSNGSMPAMRVGGDNTYIGNVSVTKKSGSAVIVDGASDTLIENCNQGNVTQRGFVYGVGFRNLTIRNVSTAGNYYENEMRFHGFDGLWIKNVKIDGANPAADQSNVMGLKDNALRIHDGANAFVSGLTATGNVTFGVMDGDNGGYSDLRHGDKKEYKRKMRLTSNVTADHLKIFGNLVLSTNLKFKISHLDITSWKRGACISVNGQYGPFKNGNGLIRGKAQGTLKHVTAHYVSPPPARNIDSLNRLFSRSQIDAAGSLIVGKTRKIKLLDVSFENAK